MSNNLFEHLRHIPGQPLAYLSNPKAGCTSIQLTLWHAHSPETAPENPNGHNLKKPFVSGRNMTREAEESLLSAKFFSVVRNPYTRLASAYLDKTLKPANWITFSVRLGFTPAVVPSIESLLDAMMDSDPAATDKHFRPQHFNLFTDLAPMDHVGHMERMGEVESYLSAFGLAWRSYELHATKANERAVDYLTPRFVNAVQRYYARDFELFGYAEDPAMLAPVRLVTALRPSREPLRRWLGDHVFAR